MAGSGNTVTLTFAGDDRNLSRVLAGLSGKTRTAEDSIRSFGARAAILTPALGYAVGAVGGLSGAMGLLPSMAFAGALGLGALAIGTQGFGDAIKNMDDPAKFAEAIAKLSPAARETAVAIRDLKPQFDGLRASVQNQLFSGVAGELRLLSGALLPTLNTQLGLSAGSFNRTALSFMGWLRMPSTITDMNTALGGSQGFLDGILRAVLPVSQALLNIGVVAAPYVRQLGDYIAMAAQKFSDFVARARESGQLNEWISKGVEIFKTLWNVITMVGQAIWNLAVAFGSSGLPSVLELVAGALLKVSQFIRDNATVMVPLITVIGGLVLAFKGFMVVTGIITSITRVVALWTGANWLLNASLLANPITWIVLGIIALIAAIVLCIVYWDEIKAAAVGAVTWIVTKWFEAVAWLTGIWNTIKGVALAVWTMITTWIGQKIAEILAFIAWLAAIPGRIGAWFGQAKDWAVQKLTELAAWVAGLPGRIFGALGALAGLAGRALAWFGGMVMAAIGKGFELLGWMAGLPGRLLGALGRLGSLLLGVGHDLVMGLWNGIRAGWDWLIGAVRSLASSLLSAAKGALGIASPSKLFRDEIGRWIPEGMAVGISANTGNLIKTARELADLATAAAMPDLASPAASAAPALNGIRSNAGAAAATTNVVIHVGGSIRSDRELVSLVRDELDRGGFRGVR